MLPSSNLEVRPEVDTKSTSNSIVRAGRKREHASVHSGRNASPARKIAPILISLLSSGSFLVGLILVEERACMARMERQSFA